ncbi:hypothetical protein OG497_37815 [Streptomyces sp. NBC_01242]|uniref:hypothetical protein n=1 Tax=Streptomyces sp. NBC_01242 TaxID=2903795 RepID=UPI0022567BE0|nr:hypothetical protein [Streptomyces sp. NBC_01242]MCX4799616.1 hypothetical protein [Streptomyces sp. NBC_01242]
MEYRCTVAAADRIEDAPTRYNDATATELLRRAIGHGCTLAAEAATGTITITTPDRAITLTPAEPLPTPTAAQRRETLALAASHGPIVWAYGGSNVIQLRDGERLIKHAMTMSLINGGYLPNVEGRHVGAAPLTLLAYLVIGKRNGDDATLTAALRNIYSRPRADA